MITWHIVVLAGYFIFGLCLGLYYYSKGLRAYRDYRFVADTPEVPIRSLAMGFVTIHGKAVADQCLSSPVTHTPCCCYQVRIQSYGSDGKWEDEIPDFQCHRFYLEDGTGKVLVDASGAELELIQSAYAETGPLPVLSSTRVLSALGLPPTMGRVIAEPELRAYAQKTLNPKGLGSNADRRRYRLMEYLLLPGHWYDVAGTCVENSSAQNPSDHLLIQKGQNETIFSISWRSEKELRRTLRNRALLYIVGGAALALLFVAILVGMVSVLQRLGPW